VPQKSSLMTRFAYLDITTAAAARLAAIHATGDDHELARSYRHERSRRQRLLVRALLRALLARHYPVPAAGWRILRESGGAPRLAAADVAAAPFVSLSHSGDLVACAVSAGGPIGIDVERIRPERPVAALAETAFGPREADAVLRLGAAEFYRIWTLREAFIKAAGTAGLMDRTDLVPFGTTAGRRIDGRDWHFQYRDLPGQYGLGLVAAAAEDPELTECR
jgi:phosphopantetheinyl transferase